MMDVVQPFREGKLPLSNLHKCPEGYVLKHNDKVFLLSEHMYQYRKLTSHGKAEADSLLEEEDPFKVMQKAQEILPEEQTSSEWKCSAETEMLEVCEIKFRQCEHSQDVLLCSKLTLVEVTGDLFWGFGLNLEQTMSCLSEFWSGRNMMGVTFHAVYQILFAEQDQHE